MHRRSQPNLRHRIRDWCDERTGYRAGLRHLLHEQLPAGTGWWFVIGSVLMFLLAVQLATGVVLAMYYVPSPEFAYDSVRFIMDRLTFGSILRSLHGFGASFIVIAAVVHMLRVVAFGSYKAPREVTWLTGVLLLFIIFAFALTGYLLPWDQKAYWATTVTINVARSTPLVGEWAADLLRGGADLGALTLLRWYAVHVFLLPAALIGFAVAHLFLMRRHHISGPIAPVHGPPRSFYPHHVLKDTLAIAAVFSALLALAVLRPLELDPIADPMDTTYVPRPEWYFLFLFQLLKYFPGWLEPVATIVIPGVIAGALLLLPFLDRRRERHPLKRPLVSAGFLVLGLAVSALTYLGLKDAPQRSRGTEPSLLALAGAQFVQDGRCQQCHRVGGTASPIGSARPRRDPEWLASHVADPEIIAPGIRPAPNAVQEGELRAILAFVRTLPAASLPVAVEPAVATAGSVFARSCFFCHVLDGEGGTLGPDLTHIGARRDAQWLRDWISDPSRVDSDEVDTAVSMPGFRERLSEAEIVAIADYLAARK